MTWKVKNVGETITENVETILRVSEGQCGVVYWTIYHTPPNESLIRMNLVALLCKPSSLIVSEWCG